MFTTDPATEPALTARPALIERLGRRLDFAAARAALWPFLATRVAFIIIGVAAPILYVGHPTRTPPLPDGTGWALWDARWFTGIAMHGYGFREDVAGHYFPAAAFFTLFPLAIRALTLTGLNADAAGTL